MSSPYRIEWSEQARADVRRVARATAMRIFEGVLHYGRTRTGDVEPLRGDLAGSFPLRVGDYRVVFRVVDDVMRISGVQAPQRGLPLRLAANIFCICTALN